MAEERHFQNKIILICKEDLLGCISDVLKKTTEGSVVITVVGIVDGQEIWSEAEMENGEVLEWIEDLSKSCSITLVHFSNGDILNKTWRLVNT